MGAVAIAAPKRGHGGREAAAGPVVPPVQPVRSEPPPPSKARLPFGEATISPTTLVAVSPHQTLRVRVDFSRSVGTDALEVKVYRPKGKVFDAASLGTRRIDAGAARADSSAQAVFSDLMPNAGDYRVDISDADGNLVERAKLVVYNQHRLPPSAGGGGSRAKGPFSRRLEGPSRAFAGDEVEQDINAQSGDQAETYVGVNPADASRAIAGVNPASGPVQAFVSNDFLAPGTNTVRDLPTSALKKDSADPIVSTQPQSLCCDPAFAGDASGNLWYAVLSSDGTPADLTSHIVINRVAGPTGTSFQTDSVAIPKLSTAGTQDKPMIAIDHWPGSPHEGRLYATWVENAGTSQNVVMSFCDTQPTVSDCDTPANWTASPIHVTDAASTYTYPSIAASPSGDVFVSWWDAGGGATHNAIEANKSTDGGATWGSDTTVSALDASFGSGTPFFCPIISAPGGRVGAISYVGVDSAGNVFVAFSDLRSETDQPGQTSKCQALATDTTWDSFIARSTLTDTIPTTATATRLSDDALSDLNDWYLPTLAVDPSTDEVQSNLYSTANDSTGQQTDQFYARSPNGGAGFDPLLQLTSQPSDYSASSNLFDYGDYQGAAAADGLMFPVWTDNRAFHGGDAELYILGAPSPATITSGPTGATTDTKPTFGFTTAAPRKLCAVDAGPFSPCTSPRTIGPLAPGTHRFRVLPTDVVGNRASRAAASRAFSVSTGGGGGGGTTAPAPGPTAPAKASFAGSKSSIRVHKNRKCKFTFHATPGLTGTAVFKSVKKVLVSKKKRVTLARKRFTVPASGKVTLRIRLSKKKFRILKLNRKIRVRVTVTLKNAAGLTSKASKKITLKAPKRKPRRR